MCIELILKNITPRCNKDNSVQGTLRVAFNDAKESYYDTAYLRTEERSNIS